MCCTSGSTLCLGGGLRRALCCCWQPEHTIELHQSLCSSWARCQCRAALRPSLCSSGCSWPQEDKHAVQERLCWAALLCQPCPSSERATSRSFQNLPPLCKGLLPVIPKGVSPRFHPTKGDFKLDRVRMQTCFSRSLIFILSLRTEFLHTGYDTSIDHRSWPISGSMCTKQRGLIKIWVCACQKPCGVIMGCHLGLLKHDIWHNLINTEELEPFVFYAFNTLRRQDELCSRRVLCSTDGRCSWFLQTTQHLPGCHSFNWGRSIPCRNVSEADSVCHGCHRLWQEEALWQWTGFGESQPGFRLGLMTQMLKRLSLFWLVVGQVLSFEGIVQVQNLQAPLTAGM